jgi:hypothetical protein
MITLEAGEGAGRTRTVILMRLRREIVREGLIETLMLLPEVVGGRGEGIRIARGVIIGGMSNGGRGVEVQSGRGRGMGGIEMMWRGGKG